VRVIAKNPGGPLFGCNPNQPQVSQLVMTVGTENTQRLVAATREPTAEQSAKM